MPFSFDIDELKTFVLLAEDGNFTETARRLQISQPAVSQRIAKLENAFGLVLFTRCAERAVLTPCGEKILSASRRCVERHLALAARLQSYSASSDAEKVRIWIDSQAIGRRAASLAKLEIIDDVQLEQVGALNDWQEALKSGAVDLVFTATFLPTPSPLGLHRLNVHHEAGISAFWRSDKFSFPEPFTLGALMGVPVFTGCEKTLPGFRSFIDDWCRRIYGRPLDTVRPCRTSSELSDACREGLGIGLAPGNAGARYALDEGMTVRTLFGGALPQAYSYAFVVRVGESRSSITGIIDALSSSLGPPSGCKPWNRFGFLND